MIFCFSPARRGKIFSTINVLQSFKIIYRTDNGFAFFLIGKRCTHNRVYPCVFMVKLAFNIIRLLPAVRSFPDQVGAQYFRRITGGIPDRQRKKHLKVLPRRSGVYFPPGLTSKKALARTIAPTGGHKILRQISKSPAKSSQCRFDAAQARKAVCRDFLRYLFSRQKPTPRRDFPPINATFLAI